MRGELSVSLLVGVRLRELRLEAEMTQVDVATRAGFTRPTINRIERGYYRDVKLDTVCRFAEALEVEPGLVWCVLDPVWRVRMGWSVGEVLRWWPRGREHRSRVPCNDSVKML